MKCVHSTRSYYYKLLVILNTEHRKKGKEFLLEFEEHNNKNKETISKRIGTKDLQTKNQKINKNTIGNTLVNILNNKEQLLDTLNNYCIKVDNDKLKTKELIKTVNQLYREYNLNNIENDIKEEIYNNIKTAIKLCRKEKEYIKLSLTEQYKKVKIIYEKEFGTSNEFEQIYKFIIEISKFSSLRRHINECILLEEYGISIIRKLYQEQSDILLRKLCAEFNHIFRIKDKQFSFIINSFIMQFINDLTEIITKFDNKYIVYHKREIINYLERLKATNTNITYIPDTIKYCYENFNSVELSNDITKIFITSLIKDVEYIYNSVNEYISTKTMFRDSIKIPTSIMFDNTSKNLLKKLNISSLSENTIGYIYNINNLTDLLNVTLYALKMDNKVISKCKNCGRYFVSNKKNTEIFCRRIDPKTKNQVSCIKIGRQVNNTAIDNEIKNIYHKIYNRLCNKNTYTKKEREDFQNSYRQKIEELKENEHDKKTWENDLKIWLENYDKELKSKYPNNKYDKVGKKKYTSTI